GLPCAGLRSSPKTDNADLPESTHCLHWGRFAAQREQARSPQWGGGVAFESGVGATKLIGLRGWLFGGLLSTIHASADKYLRKSLSGLPCRSIPKAENSRTQELDVALA
ncbi:hypothetical protein LRQ11_02285, partial [Pseudomonas sp. MAFF 311095]|uniref:hypothetical protein n=1 Tax=Pseudomonas petroselini TaxID=2899822 RepID=UPI0020B41231